MKNLLRQYRERKGLTLKQMGAKIGYGFTTIATYENATVSVSDEFLQKASKLFGVSKKELFEPDTPAALEARRAANENFPFNVLRADQLKRLIKESMEEVDNAPSDRRFLLHRLIHEANDELFRRVRGQEPPTARPSAPSSYAIPPGDRKAIAAAAADVDRELRGSRAASRAGAPSGGTSAPSGGSSPASKAKRPVLPGKVQE